MVFYNTKQNYIKQEHKNKHKYANAGTRYVHVMQSANDMDYLQVSNIINIIYTNRLPIPIYRISIYTYKVGQTCNSMYTYYYLSTEKQNFIN